MTAVQVHTQTMLANEIYVFQVINTAALCADESLEMRDWLRRIERKGKHAGKEVKEASDPELVRE